MISGEGERIAHIWAWSSVDDTGARGEQAQGEGTAGKARFGGGERTGNRDRGGGATADWLLIERDG